MFLDLERQIGIRGSVAWLVTATEFPTLLDLVYQCHVGEVWLYNNDLAMFLNDETTFQRIYLQKVAGSLLHNITAVKIMLSREAEAHVFPDRGGPSKLFLQRMQAIAKSGGLGRLHSFYFGRVGALEGIEELRRMPSGQAWVFYTQRGDLKPPSYGVAMMRPKEYPFYQSPSEQYAIGWQIGDDERSHVLRPALQDAFKRCFREASNFIYVKSLDAWELAPAWSDATERRQREQTPVFEDTLAFGQKADVALVASASDELEAIKALLGQVKRVPGSDNRAPVCACATLPAPPGGNDKRLLLAELGEGIVVAATQIWELLEKYDPQHVILFGVAGAHARGKPLNIGDVVVAETVVDYEHGSIVDSERWTEWVQRNQRAGVTARAGHHDSSLFERVRAWLSGRGLARNSMGAAVAVSCPMQASDRDRCPALGKASWEFRSKGESKWNAPPLLRAKAGDLVGAWPEKSVEFPDAPPGVPPRPRAHIRTIGSGAKVVENPSFIESMVHPVDRKICVVETEAAGVCCAVSNCPSGPKRVLVVRGIMDKANAETRSPEGREACRKYAAGTCARFVYDLLRSL